MARTSGHLEPTALLRIATLRFGLSPRFTQEDASHVAALTETIDQLPPIVVRRATNEVIDGVHRTLAAAKAGRRVIAAELFDGTEQEAFVRAVGANVTHGKPLTVEEREAAAARILRDHANWSDRRLAGTCGLSVAAVARVRRSTTDTAQLNTRLGRDGRRRPEDPAAQRRRIAEILRADPTQPLRRVAAKVGASPATVLDVRHRLERGEDPLPPRLQGQRRGESDGPPPTRTNVAGSVGQRWRTDPALTADAVSAEFASWFDRGNVTDREWERYIAAIPVNRLYQVIDEVQRRADSWSRFGQILNERVRRTSRPLDQAD